jgi:hypothetical protein
MDRFIFDPQVGASLKKKLQRSSIRGRPVAHPTRLHTCPISYLRAYDVPVHTMIGIVALASSYSYGLRQSESWAGVQQWRVHI